MAVGWCKKRKSTTKRFTQRRGDLRDEGRGGKTTMGAAD
jgi:hypothetical protein